jgi:hypothetical protein
MKKTRNREPVFVGDVAGIHVFDSELTKGSWTRTVQVERLGRSAELGAASSEHRNREQRAGSSEPERTVFR